MKHNYENQKITATGLKYVEDTSAKLTQEIKEVIAENPFIKRVAEKFDTFVRYVGTTFDSNFKEFSSKTFLGWLGFAKILPSSISPIDDEPDVRTASVDISASSPRPSVNFCFAILDFIAYLFLFKISSAKDR